MSSAPYIPTSYTAPIQDDGDTTFWGSLIQPGLGHAPSDIFPRFTDALFFYLDENVEPKKSGYIEPSKVVFWIKATRGNTLSPNPDDLNMYNRVAFGVWKIPFRVVTARQGNPQAGQEITILDRYGFMMYMLANVRADPEGTTQGFRASIMNFGLVDPLTRLRFPPMPRASLPDTADSEAVKLEAVVMQRYQSQAEEMLAAATVRAQIEARGRQAAISAIGGGSWEYRYI